MKKTLQVANGIAIVSVIIINYLAASGLINGNTVGEVSALYQNYFTPAGYAFSIWSLIYIGLFAFSIYQGRSLFINEKDDEVVGQVGWWFVISSLANILWIITWIYNYIGLSVLIMIILLFSLVQIIFKTGMELHQAKLSKIAFVWWPFSLYAGWITVALIANIAAWLTSIGWNGWGISEIAWTVVMLIAAGIINVAITWSRNMREFALVGVWALIAIAVANWGEVPTIFYMAIITAVVIFISSCIHGFKNRKENRYLWKIKN